MKYLTNLRGRLSDQNTRLKNYINQNPVQIGFISLILGVIIGGEMVRLIYSSESWLSTLFSHIESVSLAALIAAISLFWVHLRGPAIVCSPIDSLSISSHPNISSPNPTIKLSFILSNSGGSTGVVENILLKIIEIPSDKYPRTSSEQTFWMHKGFGKIPILIESGSAINMDYIEFTCRNNGFRFREMSYRIEICLLLSKNPKIPRRVYEIKPIKLNKEILKLKSYSTHCLDPLSDVWAGEIAFA